MNKLYLPAPKDFIKLTNKLGAQKPGFFNSLSHHSRISQERWTTTGLKSILRVKRPPDQAGWTLTLTLSHSSFEALEKSTLLFSMHFPDEIRETCNPYTFRGYSLLAGGVFNSFRIRGQLPCTTQIIWAAQKSYGLRSLCLVTIDLERQGAFLPVAPRSLISPRSCPLVLMSPASLLTSTQQKHVWKGKINSIFMISKK